MKKTYREYWNSPSLTSDLTEEQRSKLTAKFLKLVKKE